MTCADVHDDVRHASSELTYLFASVKEGGGKKGGKNRRRLMCMISIPSKNKMEVKGQALVLYDFILIPTNNKVPSVHVCTGHTPAPAFLFFKIQRASSALGKRMVGGDLLSSSPISPSLSEDGLGFVVVIGGN